jgi:hypothetical protein
MSKANLWSVSEIRYTPPYLHYTWEKYHYPHHVSGRPTTLCQTSVKPYMTTPTHNHWKFHHSLRLPRCIDESLSVLFFLLCTANPRKTSWFTHYTCTQPAIVRRACAVTLTMQVQEDALLVHCMFHFSWKWMKYHDLARSQTYRFPVNEDTKCTTWTLAPNGRPESKIRFII